MLNVAHQDLGYLLCSLELELPTHTRVSGGDTRIEGLALYAYSKVQGIKGKSPNGGRGTNINVSMRLRLPHLGYAKTMSRKRQCTRLHHFTNNGLIMAQIRRGFPREKSHPRRWSVGTSLTHGLTWAHALGGSQSSSSLQSEDLDQRQCNEG